MTKTAFKVKSKTQEKPKKDGVIQKEINKVKKPKSLVSDTSSQNSIKRTGKKIQYSTQPIVHMGKVIEYEKNPHEYLKERRKLQNRLSATRMRQAIKSKIESMQEAKGKCEFLKRKLTFAEQLEKQVRELKNTIL